MPMTRIANKIPVSGPIVIIGFGSIGRGLLPLIEQHFACDRDKITFIDPSDEYRSLLDLHGMSFVKTAITKDNYIDILKPLLDTGIGQAMCVNVAIDVSSVDVMRLCRDVGALYVDASVEPWLGFYLDRDLTPAERSVYALRESMLAEKPKAPVGTPTAASCCGANPGLASWLLKQALLNLAYDSELDFDEPKTRLQWAQLMQRCGVKGVHIAERDTQLANFPKPMDTFVNTWSADGLISEGLQPAELGWGSHEKWMPPDAQRHETGCKAAIYLMRPGGNTRVRSWCPTPRSQFGFLIPHNEAISIADYFTVGEGDYPEFRPTCHYAYHPCNHAVLSLNEMFGKSGGRPQPHFRMIEEPDIVEGGDELGVLLYGHAKNAYWYGSYLDIEDVRRIAPYQNATGMQVTSGVLAGMVWAFENPRSGLVEPEEMDFRRCLEIQRPYLGKVFGQYTDWTPLKGRPGFFPEHIDEEDPWQFRNILVQDGGVV